MVPNPGTGPKMQRASISLSNSVTHLDKPSVHSSQAWGGWWGRYFEPLLGKHVLMETGDIFGVCVCEKDVLVTLAMGESKVPLPCIQSRLRACTASPKHWLALLLQCARQEVAGSEKHQRCGCSPRGPVAQSSSQPRSQPDSAHSPPCRPSKACNCLKAMKHAPMF